ncbi:MAG: hypothetical protein BWK75_04650 [Candidatus Altiarchaeales archaeon A3]|nr:MAG: hypothetical protein BWK75_04650 [Candidatus Altiarchaeales archaeon A3]
MRCQECRGTVFVFGKIHTEKAQQDAIKRYLKNTYLPELEDKKENLIANLESAKYIYKDGIIEIMGKNGMIGNLTLKSDMKIDKRYGCQSGGDALIYHLGEVRFEKGKTIEYVENNKDEYFTAEEFSQDKEKQTMMWEILKKNLDKNIINKTILSDDLKDVDIYNEGYGIVVKKENKAVLLIYLKCVLSLNVEKEKEWTIGFTEKTDNEIQIFYESAFPDAKTGEIICSNCGTIMESEIIDTGAEWRSFDSGQREKRSRASGAIKDAKVSKGLTTEIDRYDRDAKGGGFEAERKVELYRMRRLQTRSRMSDSVGRNLSIALPELDRMCSLLELGETIKEECAHLYRQAVDKGFVKGRSIESIIGAIVCYVTRNKGEPRTLEEIAEKSGISKKEIGRSYKHVLKSMNLKPPRTNVEDYITLYASKLGISNTAEEEAQKILANAKQYGITAGRGPSGIAGAVIYLACEHIGEEFPKKELLDLVGITLSTLHSRQEEIKNKLKL